MFKGRLIKLLSGVVFVSMLGATPASAGFPTLDVSEVFNTVQSFISQTQAKISTVQETISVSNIQQAIGDKLGGLNVIKDAKAKAEKLKEKADKAKKRLDKVNQLKKKYEDAKKFVNDQKEKVEGVVNDAKGKYDQAMGMVNDAKNTIDNVKNQAENVVNEAKDKYDQAKGMYENVKSQVENAPDLLNNKINDIKGQYEGVANQAQDRINQVQDKVNTLGGGTGQNSGFGSTSGYDNGYFDPSSIGHPEDGDYTEGLNGDFFYDETSSFEIQDVPAGRQSVTFYPPRQDVVLWGEDEDLEPSYENGTSEPKVEGKPVYTTIEGEEVSISDDGGAIEDVRVQRKVIRSPVLSAVDQEVQPDVSAVTVPTNDEFQANIGKKSLRRAFTKSDSTDTLEEPAQTPTVQKVTKTTVQTPAETKVLEATSVTPAVQKQAVGIKENVTEKMPVGKISNIEKGVSTVSEPVTEMAPQAKTLRKAFDKVSYSDTYTTTFAAESASFKTGTDGDGNYYFPDTFAQWTGIGYDDKIDEDKIIAAFQSICDDLRSSDSSDAAKYEELYEKIVAEGLAFAQASAAVSENEAESGKTADDLEKSLNMGGSETLTQLSGIGEIASAEINQLKREIIVAADEIQLFVIDAVHKYCYTYEKEDKEDAS